MEEWEEEQRELNCDSGGNGSNNERAYNIWVKDKKSWIVKGYEKCRKTKNLQPNIRVKESWVVDRERNKSGEWVFKIRWSTEKVKLSQL